MTNVHLLGALLRNLSTGLNSALGANPAAAVAAPTALRPVGQDEGRAAADAAGNRTDLRAWASTPGGSATTDATASRTDIRALVPTLDAQAPASGAALTSGATLTSGALAEHAAAPNALLSPLASRPAALSVVNHAATPVVAPATPEPSVSLHLSAVAQLLHDLLPTVVAPRLASIDAAQTLIAASPRTSSDTQALATALQRSIADSGVFYESHLARWTLQQYPAAHLANEPQAGWQSASETTPVVRTGDAAALSPQPSAVLPEEARPILRQQLQALDAHELAWRGGLWPGQAATIEINEDEAAPEAAVDPTWRTRIKLSLPTLGEVDVALALRETTLQLRVAAHRSQSVAALNQRRQALLAALDAQAFEITGLAIQHGRPR